MQEKGVQQINQKHTAPDLLKKHMHITIMHEESIMMNMLIFAKLTTKCASIYLGKKKVNIHKLSMYLFVDAVCILDIRMK